jgi:hypothetical protein
MNDQNQPVEPTGPVSCVRIASHDRASSLLAELFALATPTLADTPSRPYDMPPEVARKLAARAVGMAMVARRLAKEIGPCES